jgi:hypothetical protein
MPPSDWWHPMWWFPMFPFLFIVLCLVIFLLVMVPMMSRHGPWSHRREAMDLPPRTADGIGLTGTGDLSERLKRRYLQSTNLCRL